MTKTLRHYRPNENHHDLLGRMLSSDRYVAVAWSQPQWQRANGVRTHLSIGKIVRFTPKMVEVEINSGAGSTFIIKALARNVLLLEDNPDLFLWLLSNGI